MNRLALERAGIGALLLPYQARWILDRSKIKVCVKSRRIGITWATAYEACEVAATSAEDGGSHFYYQTYAEKDAKDFIEDCARWARAMDQWFQTEVEVLEEDAAREWFILPAGENSINITSIRFSSGHKIVALPHSPRKMRGKGGVYCLDEAAYHPSFEEALRATEAFEIWGGRTIIISSITDEDSPFTQYVRDIQAGRVEDATLHIITLADAYEEGLYKRVCLKQGKPWSQEDQDHELARLLRKRAADQEFLCIPRRSSGQYIPPSLCEPCMYDAPVLRLAKKDDFLKLPVRLQQADIASWLDKVVAPAMKLFNKAWPSFLGMDFGRSSDLSVIAPGQIAQKLSLRIPFIVELDNIPFGRQRQIFQYIFDGMPRRCYAALDATGNGAELGEWALLRYGESLIEPIKIQLPWYAENLPKMKARFEDMSIQVPRDLDVRRDISMLEVIDGVPRLPKKRIAAQREEALKGMEMRHGDAAIAIAMLCYAAARPVIKYDYKKVPKRGGDFAFDGVL